MTGTIFRKPLRRFVVLALVAIAGLTGPTRAQENLKQHFKYQGGAGNIDTAISGDFDKTPKYSFSKSPSATARFTNTWHNLTPKQRQEIGERVDIPADVFARAAEILARYSLDLAIVDSAIQSQSKPSTAGSSGLLQNYGDTRPWIAAPATPEYFDSTTITALLERYRSRGATAAPNNLPLDLTDLDVYVFPGTIPTLLTTPPSIKSKPDPPKEFVILSGEYLRKFLEDLQIEKPPVTTIEWPAPVEPRTPTGPTDGLFPFDPNEPCPYCQSVNPTSSGGALTLHEKSNAAANHLRYQVGIAGCSITTDTTDYVELLNLVAATCPKAESLTKKAADAEHYWHAQTAACGEVVGKRYAENIDKAESYEDTYIYENRQIVKDYYEKCFSSVDHGPAFTALLKPYVGYLFENTPLGEEWSRCTVTFFTADRAITARHCFLTEDAPIPLDKLRVSVGRAVYEIEELYPNPLAAQLAVQRPSMGLEDSLIFRIKGALPSVPDWFSQTTPQSPAHLHQSQLFYVAFPADITHVATKEARIYPDQKVDLEKRIPVLEDSLSCRISGITDKGCVLTTCQSMGGASGAVLFAIRSPDEISILGVLGGVLRPRDWMTEKFQGNSCSFAGTTINNGIELSAAYTDIPPPDFGLNFASPITHHFQ